MKTGIDGIMLRERGAGSLRYFEELLTGLANAEARHEYTVYINTKGISSEIIPRKGNFSYKDVTTPSIVPRALTQQLFFAWNESEELDLLHSPVFVPPLLSRCRTVTTIFDLTFSLYPETMKWTGRMWWRLLGKRGIEKADCIIALSESTRKDVCRTFGIAEEKVRVVYPCTRSIFKPSTRERFISKSYRLPDKYILYVGTLERRKNLSCLVRAFALARHMGIPNYRLVLCGNPGWLYQDIYTTIEELELTNEVILLGYTSDEELPALYSGADLFAYPSLYEGFGLPVLEAMACGTPVVASNSSSLPEVVGSAGSLVPPSDVDQLAAEMVRVLTDRTLHDAMVEQGLRRAELFSQERFVTGILNVYNDVGSEKQQTESAHMMKRTNE